MPNELPDQPGANDGADGGDGRPDEQQHNGGEQQRRRQKPTQSPTSAGPTFAAAEPRVEDLSREIIKTVGKAAGEQVTCRRIFGDHYRCNWWAASGTDAYDNPSMTGQMVTTHRVSRSQMLRVTKSAGKL